MAYSIEKQYDLFELAQAEPVKPGDWVETHGRELTFEELAHRLGRMVIMDYSTQSHEWFKVVRIDRIAQNKDGRMAVFFDGTHQKGQIGEMWFSDRIDMARAHAYELAQTMKDPKSDFPCDDCVFDKNGVCTHIEGPDFFCENGSFQITKQQAICSKCGKTYEVRQDDIGPDFGVCRKCGMHCIFNNQGNRPGAYELWKRGELIGE